MQIQEGVAVIDISKSTEEALKRLNLPTERLMGGITCYVLGRSWEKVKGGK